MLCEEEEVQEVQVVVGERGRRVLVFGFIFARGKIAGGVEIGQPVGRVCVFWRFLFVHGGDRVFSNECHKTDVTFRVGWQMFTGCRLHLSAAKIPL